MTNHVVIFTNEGSSSSKKKQAVNTIDKENFHENSQTKQPESNKSQKEFESPVNIGLFRQRNYEEQEEAKTPVLSQWKFSSSTKHLLTGQDQSQDENEDMSSPVDTNKTNLSFCESPSNDILSQKQEDLKSQQQGRPSVESSSDTSLDFSPSNLNMSYDWAKKGKAMSSKTAHIPSEPTTPISRKKNVDVDGKLRLENEMVSHVVSSPDTPQLDGNLKTVRAKEPLLGNSSTHDTAKTPRNTIQKSINTPVTQKSPTDVDYNSDCSDPMTPELPELSISMAKYKVPFHRSAMKSSAKKMKNRDSESHDVMENFSDGCGGDQDHASSEAESDEELEIEEIETSTRLLQPRRTAINGTDGNVNGWVPLVSAEEWTSAPSFLKMQV